MSRVLNAIRSVLMYMAGALLIAMATITVAQVFFRYFLEAPLPWAEEASRVCMIALTFLGAAAAWARREHIVIDAAVIYSPPLLRKIYAALTDLAVLTLGIAMTYYGASVTQAGMGTRTVAMGLPWGYAYAVVPVAGICLALFSARFLYQDAKRFAQTPEVVESS